MHHRIDARIACTHPESTTGNQGQCTLGRHNGDWEDVTLRTIDRRLVAVFLSRHDFGEWISGWFPDPRCQP